MRPRPRPPQLPPDSEGVVVMGAEVAALSVGAEGVRPPQRPLDPPPHDEQLLAFLSLGGSGARFN